MKTKKINIFFAAAGILGGLLSGCSTAGVDPLRIDGSSDNIVYLYTAAPANMYPVKQVNQVYPSSGIASLTFKVPALITGRASANTDVAFAVDNSLLSSYNAMMGVTPAVVLPADAVVNMGTAKVTIPKGASQSADSLTVSIDLPGIATMALGNYVLPVKIASLSAAGSRISTTASVIYLPFAVTTNTIDNRTTAPASSTAQTSFTGWSVVSSSPALTNPANMLNTTTTTYATLATPAQLTFTVDMASDRLNVAGFRMQVSSLAYQWSQMKVETSSDNVNWTWQGSPLLVVTSNYHYVAFNQKVPAARYIRVTALTWPAATTSFRIAVFQVYW